MLALGKAVPMTRTCSEHAQGGLPKRGAESGPCSNRILSGPHGEWLGSQTGRSVLDGLKQVKECQAELIEESASTAQTDEEFGS